VKGVSVKIEKEGGVKRRENGRSSQERPRSEPREESNGPSAWILSQGKKKDEEDGRGKTHDIAERKRKTPKKEKAFGGQGRGTLSSP